MNKKFSTLIIKGGGDRITTYNRILKFIYCSDNPNAYEESIQNATYDECSTYSPNIKMCNDRYFSAIETTRGEAHDSKSIKHLDDMMLNKRYTITRLWYQRFHIDLIISLLCVIGVLTLEPSSTEFWALLAVPFLQLIIHVALTFWYYIGVERKYRNILEHYDRVRMVHMLERRDANYNSIPKMLNDLERNS